MKNYRFKRAIPTIVSIGLFLIISFIYFSPQLEGKVLKSQDISMHQGMSKELADYRKDNDKEALWSNSYFSGAPSFLVSTIYKGNIIEKILLPIKKIPRPASYLILSFLFFYILLLLLGCNQWISLVGSIAYGFNSAFFIWMDTGHMSKAYTLTFMAIVVGGIIYAYNKKMVHGAIISAISLSWMIDGGHPQITYYGGIMALIIGITYFIYAIKEKTLPNFIKTSALLIVAALFAIGTNYSRLASTLEYGKYSTRSESELTDKSGNKTTGLDRDYILNYSYDMAEAVSAFIPRFKGGGMAEPVGEKSHVYQLMKNQDKNYAKRIAQALPLYWGSQPISMAPFYFGAILVFLFVFGLFALKGKNKWWLAMTVLVAFLLSLGKFFPALSNFMLDYFPGYNKFRDVKNIIVIEQFAMALLGVLAIKNVFERKLTEKEFFNALKYSFAIVGGFALAFAILPGLAGDFSSARDAGMGAPAIVDALKADRKMVLRADAFRSFIFVSLAALTLFAFWKNKLKAQYALAIWGILILADMWPVNKKYLNNDDFESKRKSEVPIQMTKADKVILTDTDPNYRVLNLAVDPFSDGTTSYYHKSLGGYHGAKLQRYQELIERGISPEMARMQQGFKNIKTQEDIDNLFAGFDVLNMLNTRYIIHSPDAQPIVNRNALGNAWFTPNVKIVANADEEIAAISKFNASNEIIIDQRFSEYLKDKNFTKDTSAFVMLTSYAPNKLEYKYNSASEQVMVFSEIYYPAGWTAYIDGDETPHFRANYVLRAMLVPKGAHNITFEFKPKTYYTGTKISMISSIILLLGLIGVILYEVKFAKAIKKE
ncbi:MAG: YfhO family protein [Salinivirgaceae bacterium]|nr:YfhO family protein [Salinivirgaceae bacterium]